MKHLFLLILLSSFFLESDEGDIVETKIVNLQDFSIDKLSYCKERASEDSLIWSQDFNQNYLSPDFWNFATSNGFHNGISYISGWGNGELQYYTKPSRKEAESNTTKNLFIEDGYLKIQPIYKKNTSRIRDDENAYNFTSARIDTKNLKSFHTLKYYIR